MKVLVTGGTGFLGSHSAAALLSAGHDVRLLVRARDRLAPALAPHGISDVDAVEGDCADPASVAMAMHGCDAVLHCANVFTWAARRQGDLVQTNTATTEHVLRQAVDAGLDPVVHVSSVAALTPSSTPLTTDSPVGTSAGGYSASKAAAERLARSLQDEGAPVVITYPGAVVGPDDPYLGVSTTVVQQMAASRFPPGVGRLGWVDVRDVAAAHAAVMVRGLGPRRYLLGGHDVSFADLARRVAAVTGRRTFPMSAPHAVMRLGGRVLDLAGQLPGGSKVALSSGVVELVFGYPGTAGDGLAELGIAKRPLDETLRDTVAWLREAGHVKTGRVLQPAGG